MGRRESNQTKQNSFYYTYFSLKLIETVYMTNIKTAIILKIATKVNITHKSTYLRRRQFVNILN